MVVDIMRGVSANKRHSHVIYVYHHFDGAACALCRCGAVIVTIIIIVIIDDIITGAGFI